MPHSAPTIFPLRNPRRVYCAGPLFNEAERREMLRIAYVLRRAGFEAFVPHADGMEFADVLPYLVGQGHDAAQAGKLLHEAVFALDVYQVVVECGSLVFNINGRAPDEGGVAEATMAWMLGKPLVLYKDDCRSAVAGRDNPLVVGQTGFQTVSDIELLPDALRRRIDELSPDEDQSVACPDHLQATLEAGGRLWRELAALGAERPAAAVAAAVLGVFGQERERASV